VTTAGTVDPALHFYLDIAGVRNPYLNAIDRVTKEPIN
jgi:hypothetical protein